MDTQANRKAVIADVRAAPDLTGRGDRKASIHSGQIFAYGYDEAKGGDSSAFTIIETTESGGLVVSVLVHGELADHLDRLHRLDDAVELLMPELEALDRRITGALGDSFPRRMRAAMQAVTDARRS